MDVSIKDPFCCVVVVVVYGVEAAAEGIFFKRTLNELCREIRDSLSEKAAMGFFAPFRQSALLYNASSLRHHHQPKKE